MEARVDFRVFDDVMTFQRILIGRFILTVFAFVRGRARAHGVVSFLL